MIGLQSIQAAPDSRILCISNRLIEPVISRCLRYEFEDVIAGVDRIDLAGPVRPRIRSTRLRRAVGWLDGRVNKGRGGPKKYDLLFFGMQMLSDLHPLVPWGASKPGAALWACYI